jgi:DNA-binding XRE family transcriptional regulator
MTNRLKQIRENLLISKSELARRAGVSLLTITRVENGEPCRTETKRKIVVALGIKPSQSDLVFPSNHTTKNELNFSPESDKRLKNQDVDQAAS